MHVHKIPLAGNPEAKMCATHSIRRALIPEEFRSLIARHPFFDGMSERHLKILASLALEMNFEPGHYIFKKGDTANRFFVILEGKVQLELSFKARRVHTFLAVDELGSSCLLEPHFVLSSAQVIAPTRTICFCGAILRQYCGEDHDFGYEIMSRVGRAILKKWRYFRPKLEPLQGGFDEHGTTSNNTLVRV